MASRDLTFFPPAERFLDTQAFGDRIRLVSICADLADDPFVDGETKFAYMVAPVMMRLWTDGVFWVLYYFDESVDCVKVYNIGRHDTSPPSLR